ncbi:hypothetical protein ACHAQJ_010696, partial [Trichoderma viride]
HAFEEAISEHIPEPRLSTDDSQKLRPKDSGRWTLAQARSRIRTRVPGIPESPSLRPFYSSLLLPKRTARSLLQIRLLPPARGGDGAIRRPSSGHEPELTVAVPGRSDLIHYPPITPRCIVASFRL